MRISSKNRTLLKAGAGLFTALLLGVLPSTSQAQTYYFTEGGPTTATNVNTYFTGTAAGDGEASLSTFQLGTVTGSFSGTNPATALVSEPQGAELIQAYVNSGEPWVPADATFNLATPGAYTSFSGQQALWMNPNNAPGTESYGPITASAWGGGTWNAEVTFEIDDVSLYSGFFIEGQHYADDSITATLNGHVISLPSVNVGWQNAPAAASSFTIDSSYFIDGVNTLVFTITNSNPTPPGLVGPSGFDGYGRIGATLVPEPTSALLIGTGSIALLALRRTRRK